MRCFYSHNLQQSYGELNESDKKHLFTILRGKVGDKILLIDGIGGMSVGIIQSDRRISIVNFKQLPITKIKIHLFTALPRKQKMDILLSQCTEAGIWEFHPIITKNSVAFPGKETKIDRWQSKILESCKQAHNPFIPKINPPVKLLNALDKINQMRLLPFYGSTNNLNQSSLQFKAEKLNIAWLVGPEGGFTPNELNLFTDRGITAISINRWILRVETAAVLGVSLLQNRIKELFN